MTVSRLRQLPLGRSTFSTLRKSDSIYVDKTDLLFALCQNDSKVFLARPHLFGKSLLISTFESLFKYGLRDFKGLAIEKLWNDQNFQVVRLDFSLIRNFRSIEDFEDQFISYIAESFRSAGFSGNPSFTDWNSWLQSLEDRSIVLLIDEYDAPLTECLDQEELFYAVQSLMSRFFLMVKSSEGCLRFFFMTGVTKLSNTGIFSGFNNLQDISLVSEYGALLGYTSQEIIDNFKPYIERAASELGTNCSEILEGLQRHYNGFCFDEKASRRVYCPWSVLNFLNIPSRGFLNYWYESAAHPAVLMKYLKNHLLTDPTSYTEPKEIKLT